MSATICSSISPEAIREVFDPRLLVHVKKHIIEGPDETNLYDGAALSGKVFKPESWTPKKERL